MVEVDVGIVLCILLKLTWPTIYFLDFHIYHPSNCLVEMQNGLADCWF